MSEESGLPMCIECGANAAVRGRFCSRTCIGSALGKSGRGRPKSTETRRRISSALKGKPKPWMRGEKNHNYDGKTQAKPGVLDHMREQIRRRGQAWTEANRETHSQLMRGPANKMRGRKHNAVSVAAISASKRAQYERGTVKLSRNKLSRAERALGERLAELGYDVATQFHILGVPFLYDFRAGDRLVEFQGDYWHANPRRYPPGTLLNIQNVGVRRVEDVWLRDRLKLSAAVGAGYSVAYIWESEFKRDGVDATARRLAALLGLTHESASSKEGSQ